MMEEKKTTAPLVSIYVDGSAKPNPGHGGWAALLVHDGRVRMVVGEQNSTTNVEMELRAVFEGLKRLKKPCLVNIHTDSQYVEGGMRALKFGRIYDTHTELWRQVFELYRKQTAVRIIEITAHRADNDPLHKVCDRYARFMARRQVKPMDRIVDKQEVIKEATGQ